MFTTNVNYEAALPAEALSCTSTVAADYSIQTFTSPAEVCHSAQRAPVHLSAAAPLATSVALTRLLLRPLDPTL